MNKAKTKEIDPQRSYILLSEITDGEHTSQRALAKKMGVALGLVNSYLKHFVAKGYVRMKTFPRNRYSYLLTPEGLAEKSRLAVAHISYLTNLYRDARAFYREQLVVLRDSGNEFVSFCGIDELTEIAYLSAIEVGVKIDSVIAEAETDNFMGIDVKPLAASKECHCPIMITSVKQGVQLAENLKEFGVPEDQILPAYYLMLNDGAVQANDFDRGTA